MTASGQKISCYVAVSPSRSGPVESAAAEIITGVLSFAVPGQGILFRCRARGNAADLEVAALLALLRFLRVSLKKPAKAPVHVWSSTPSLVFPLVQKRNLSGCRARYQKRLQRYLQYFQVTFGYVPVRRNCALISAAELPGVPRGQKPSLEANRRRTARAHLRPLRDGIDV